MEFHTEDKNVAETVESIEGTIYTAARGCYQRDLLDGREAWSGASLKGTASSYGARYAESRSNLLDRINDVAKEYGVRFESRLVLNENRRYQRVLVAEAL